MKKIAINTCFGGFGLSDEAFELVLKKKGIDFEKKKTESNFFNYYHKGMMDNKNGYLFCNYDRDDSDMIAVIEELGDKADGWSSKLKIVEIPDDVNWHISEYDGWEHVAEDHRTWS